MKNEGLFNNRLSLFISMQGTILNQVVDTNLGPDDNIPQGRVKDTKLGAVEYVAPKTTITTTPTKLGAVEYVAPKTSALLTKFGATELVERRQLLSGPSNLGPSAYVTSSIGSRPTVYGAGTATTYTEVAFTNASKYRPPVSRPIIRPIEYVGGGVIPGGVATAPEIPVLTNGMLINNNDFFLIDSTDKLLI